MTVVLEVANLSKSFGGIKAVDGVSFTGAPVQIEVWLDAQGRLAELFAVAQNTNETTYQLLCIDRVHFDYDAPISIPDPSATP